MIELAGEPMTESSESVIQPTIQPKDSKLVKLVETAHKNLEVYDTLLCDADKISNQEFQNKMEMIIERLYKSTLDNYKQIEDIIQSDGSPLFLELLDWMKPYFQDEADIPAGRLNCEPEMLPFVESVDDINTESIDTVVEELDLNIPETPIDKLELPNENTHSDSQLQ